MATQANLQLSAELGNKRRPWREFTRELYGQGRGFQHSFNANSKLKIHWKREFSRCMGTRNEDVVLPDLIATSTRRGLTNRQPCPRSQHRNQERTSSISFNRTDEMILSVEFGSEFRQMPSFWCHSDVRISGSSTGTSRGLGTRYQSVLLSAPLAA